MKKSTITLQKAFDQDRALELAESYSASYMNTSHPIHVAATDFSDNIIEDNFSDTAMRLLSGKCFFCGNGRHVRSLGPAKEVLCRRCREKKRHYQRSCQSKHQRVFLIFAASVHTLALVPTSPSCLQKSIIKVQINRVELNVLIDAGSSSLGL